MWHKMKTDGAKDHRGKRPGSTVSVAQGVGHLPHGHLPLGLFPYGLLPLSLLNPMHICSYINKSKIKDEFILFFIISYVT